MALDIPDSSNDHSAELGDVTKDTKNRLYHLGENLHNDAAQFWERQDAEYRKSQREYFLQYRDSPDVEMRVKAASFWWFSHEDLFPKLFTDSDPRVRIALAQNDWAQSKFPKEHQELFHDPDSRVRIAMIETHGILLWQNPQFVRELLKDQDVQVRAALIKQWKPSWGSKDLVQRLVYSFDPIITNAAHQNRYLSSFIEQDQSK